MYKFEYWKLTDAQKDNVRAAYKLGYVTKWTSTNKALERRGWVRQVSEYRYELTEDGRMAYEMWLNSGDRAPTLYTWADEEDTMADERKFHVGQRVRILEDTYEALQSGPVVWGGSEGTVVQAYTDPVKREAYVVHFERYGDWHVLVDDIEAVVDEIEPVAPDERKFHVGDTVRLIEDAYTDGGIVFPRIGAIGHIRTTSTAGYEVAFDLYPGRWHALETDLEPVAPPARVPSRFADVTPTDNVHRALSALESAPHSSADIAAQPGYTLETINEAYGYLADATDDPPAASDAPAEVTGDYRCPMCARRFVIKAGLKLHLQQDHGMTTHSAPVTRTIDLKAEVERLTRERDEARAALAPFAETDDDFGFWQSFDYLFEEYTKATAEHKKYYDNPPPADEQGRWPLWYVGQIERSEKDVENRLAGLGRLLINSLDELQELKRAARLAAAKGEGE